MEYGQVKKFDPRTATAEIKMAVIKSLVKMANKALGEGKVFLILEKELPEDLNAKTVKAMYGKIDMPMDEYLKGHGYAWYHIDSPDWKEIDKPEFVDITAQDGIVARFVSHGTNANIDKYHLLETETYEEATERRGF